MLFIINVNLNYFYILALHLEVYICLFIDLFSLFFNFQIIIKIGELAPKNYLKMLMLYIAQNHGHDLITIEKTMEDYQSGVWMMMMELKIACLVHLMPLDSLEHSK